MGAISREMLIDDDAIKAPLVLMDNMKSLDEQLKNTIVSAQNHRTAISKATDSIKDATTHTSKLSDEQRILAQINNQIATANAKLSDEYQKQRAVLADLNEELKRKQQLGDKEAINIRAESSSIEQLGYALRQNQQSYARLTSEKERNSESGRKLLAVIKSQDKQYRELTDSIGKGSIRVRELSEGIEQLGSHMGETGEKGLALVNLLKSGLASGWTVVGSAIGAALFSVEQFFARTKEGALQEELLIDGINTRWDIFKNFAAGIGSWLYDKWEKASKYMFVSEEDRIEKLRQAYNKTTSEREKARIKESISELEMIIKSRGFVLEREELSKKEIELIKERSTEELKAADKMFTAYDSQNHTLKEQLDSVVEADKIYREVAANTVAFEKEKADLFAKDLTNRKGNLGLTLAEQKQIEMAYGAVRQIGAQFELSARRRLNLIKELSNEIKKANGGGEIDYGLYNQDFDKMLSSVGKLNDEDEKNRQEKDKQEMKDQQELDKFFADLDKQRSENELNEADKRWEAYQRNKKKQEEREKDMAEHEKELAMTTSRAIVQVVNDQYAYEEERVEIYLNRLSERYNEDMQIASMNQQAKLQLTEEYRTKEMKAQKELIKIRRKQAEFDRAAALFDVGIHTAVAISKDISKYGMPQAIPFIAMDAAEGAAQTIAILAKPLPQYASGTDDHVGGLAVVGEKGSELVETPSGQFYMTPDRPTIVDLPAHSKVMTNDETLKMLAYSSLKLTDLAVGRNFGNQKVVKQLQRIEAAVVRTNKQVDYAKHGALLYEFNQESDTLRTKRIRMIMGNRHVR